MGALDSQRVENAGQALGLGADVIATGGMVAVAEAWQVQRDHLIVVGQVAGEAQPVVLVRSEAMDQYQGFGRVRSSPVVMDVKIADTQSFMAEPGAILLDQAQPRQLGRGEGVEDGSAG